MISKYLTQKNFILTVNFTDGSSVFLEGCEKDVSNLADRYVKIIRGEEVYTFFTRNINYVHFSMPPKILSKEIEK